MRQSGNRASHMRAPLSQTRAVEARSAAWPAALMLRLLGRVMSSDHVPAVHERRECLPHVEPGISVERALRSSTGRLAIQDGRAKDKLGGVETIDVELTARAAHFEPDICGREPIFRWRRVGEIELHQAVHRPCCMQVAEPCLQHEACVYESIDLDR